MRVRALTKPIRTQLSSFISAGLVSCFSSWLLLVNWTLCRRRPQGIAGVYLPGSCGHLPPFSLDYTLDLQAYNTLDPQQLDPSTHRSWHLVKHQPWRPSHSSSLPTAKLSKQIGEQLPVTMVIHERTTRKSRPHAYQLDLTVYDIIRD